MVAGRRVAPFTVPNDDWAWETPEGDVIPISTAEFTARNSLVDIERFAGEPGPWMLSKTSNHPYVLFSHGFFAIYMRENNAQSIVIKILDSLCL